MAKIRLFTEKNWAILLIATAYSIWGLAFIYNSSHVGSDGRLYFVLFDDAMISMRYAWNFAHGNGLVWNPGEYVEGYTNLLMTLLMSLMTFMLEKRYAVLAVQITGIFFVLGLTYFTVKIFQTLDRNKSKFAEYLLIVSVLLYYPLNFWSLMGMETGLLAFLLSGGVFCSILYTESLNKKYLWQMVLCFGLASLTRNDSLLFAALAFLYLIQTLKSGKNQMRDFFASGLTFGLFPVGQTLFRYFYYGQIVPNTYTLKLVGVALDERLQNGWGFVQPFWAEAALAIVAATFGLFIRPSSKKFYIFGFFVISISYQIYVGGDPWIYWRIMSPAMSFIFLLFISACDEILNHVSNKLMQPLLLITCILFGLYKADARFINEMILLNLPFHVEPAHKHIEIAIGIDELTDTDATIGVFWAGTLPYYTDRIAIDFLGKSDRHIANLPPDTSGVIAWDGMNSVPGHNKYDLTYSIQTLLPTYIDGLEWGSQDLTEWGKEYYVRVKYNGEWMYLLKDSPNVFWDKVEK